MNICVPVRAESMQGALRLIGEANRTADLIELRLDAIKDPDLGRLLAEALKPVIVTNRHAGEGGTFHGPEDRRVGILREAVALGADYVDVELRTSEGLKEHLFEDVASHGSFTKIIMSRHIFAGTPPEGELVGMLDEKSCFGRIVKIVTMANSMEDNLGILRLVCAARERGREIIAFCMGEKGRLSRVAAPLFGSFLSYASLEKGAESAPGQLTIAEMKCILKSLRR